MLLKYFYDKALAHASYLVGCQQTSECIIIDPGRDIQQYLDASEQESMTIVGVAETHIHADYVSGARELAERGARLYVSDAGPPEWKYLYTADYDAQLLSDGDVFHVGKIELKTLHTPGHTPESISFVVTDKGGGANRPMGIFTGDFVFVGSIGRPDLLEEAAGLEGTADAGARDLFRSAEQFKQLPDYLQVWPAHGAGSACGKGLGSIPSSTVGYEKLFNPALQFDREQDFVDYILADQPEAPKYFALMKRVNKEGPRVLGDAGMPPQLDASRLKATVEYAQVLDLAATEQFAHAHVIGSINIPVANLAHWAGWLIDYQQPLVLIGGAHQIPEAVRVLRKIGVEQIEGFFDAEAVTSAGLRNQAYSIATPEELVGQIQAETVQLIDVRSDAEWNAGHIAEARHMFLGKLPETVGHLDTSKTFVLQCRSGVRSAIAASILQAAGAEHVINMMGGWMAWRKAGLPAVAGKAAPVDA